MPEQAVDLRGAWRLRALLTRAGVPLAAQGFAETLSPAEAQRILNALVRIRPTLGTFGPRQVALRLLGEVTASPGGITLRGLEERLRRFEPLIIVRPDGYLADALDGKAIARAGRIHLDDNAGMLRAGALDVGAFYFRRLGNLYRIDNKLAPIGDILIELPLQHGLGVVDDVLDGAEGSLENTVWGIAELIREPIRSVEALTHLPQAVVALIENSPEYWARFVAMPPSDQVREVSRLVTDLALLCGGVQGVAEGAKAAGQLGKLSFPALRLTGSGELVVATASLAVGKPIVVLTGAAGGVFVLQMAQAGGGPPQSGSAAVEQPAQSQDGEAEAAAEDDDPSSKALARALEAEGHVCPPEWAAHHIVAGKAKAADPAREVLKKFGIGINITTAVASTFCRG